MSCRPLLSDPRMEFESSGNHQVIAQPDSGGACSSGQGMTDLNNLLHPSSGFGIPRQAGLSIEEQGILQDCLSSIVRVYDRSPYPWEHGSFSIHFFAEKSYKQKCAEADAMEIIQFQGRPQAFQGVIPYGPQLYDVEPMLYAFRVPLVTRLGVDVMFLEPHPRRSVQFSTRRDLTREDIFVQAPHARLPNASARVEFTVHDDSSDQSNGQMLRMIIKTDYDNETTVFKDFATVFNKDIHRYADVRNAAMPKEDVDFLQATHDFLINNLAPFDLSMKLFSAGILTRDDLDEVEALSGDKKKVDLILKKIPRRGNVCDAFLRAVYEVDHRVAEYLAPRRQRRL